MKLIVKKEVEVEEEINSGYFVDYGIYYKLSEKGLLIVSDSSISLTKPNADSYPENALETSKYTEISEDQFIEKFLKTLDTLNKSVWISSPENVMP